VINGAGLLSGMPLEGLCVPLPTLFDDEGRLEAARNTEFARGLVAAGVRHLFALGSLGEFPSLSEEERSELLRSVADGLGSGAELWAGCGAPSTPQAVRFARAAEAAGAAVLVAVPPYYLRPTERAIERYYRELRRATSRPLLAYNIPSLVGYALAPELVHRLGREGVLAGVKDTAGSLASVASFLADAPPGFAILPGDDALAAQAIAAGAVGAIMGSANVLPRLALALVAGARSGRAVEAEARQAEVDGLLEVIRAGPFPATDKFLAEHLRGARVGYRSPYDPLAPEERTRVLAALEPRAAALRRWL
jgi:4-hydroxy-tetrahydrodipicolinate synthase